MTSSTAFFLGNCACPEQLILVMFPAQVLHDFLPPELVHMWSAFWIPLMGFDMPASDIRCCIRGFMLASRLVHRSDGQADQLFGCPSSSCLSSASVFSHSD